MNPKRSLALAASLIAACGSGKMSDLEEYVARTKARAPGPIDPIPAIEQVDIFVFEPGDRRDPFASNTPSTEALPTTSAVGIAPDPLRRREELEYYALDALKMVGTLQQQETIWALIAAPGGNLYRVRAGDYLGRNNGRITRVTEDAIEITEIVSEGANEWRERAAAIALSQ